MNPKQPDKDKSSEVSVGPSGLTVRGPAAEDLRAPLRRIAKTADSVLRLLDNVVGLPADYLSLRLEQFRDTYAKELDKVPEEARQQPSLRLGCSVLRHVAFAAEEPELQEMFARLLATASNSEHSSLAHPGFATVINDLTPQEARLLVAIRNLRRPLLPTQRDKEALVSEAGLDSGDLDRSLSNLLRLGLIDWEVSTTQPSRNSLEQIVGQQYYGRVYSQREAWEMVERAINDIQNMKNSVIRAFQEQKTSQRLRVTDFGRQFLTACMPQDEEVPAPKMQWSAPHGGNSQSTASG